MEMGGLLQQLVDKMEEAMVCAEKQANQSAHALSTITGDFTAEVQKVPPAKPSSRIALRLCADH
eukprot:6489588-Amphidinium_carterae.1